MLSLPASIESTINLAEYGPEGCKEGYTMTLAGCGGNNSNAAAEDDGIGPVDEEYDGTVCLLGLGSGI